MTDRDAWNHCRYQPYALTGHYESYFLRANHPDRPLAFWIRYTIFSPKGRPQDAVGEVWAIYFDGEQQKIAAVKEILPFSDCRVSLSGLDLNFGAAGLTDKLLEGRASSGAHTLQWAMDYDSAQRPLLLLPLALYTNRFPQAKGLVPGPDAVFNGALFVDGERISIDRWHGSQNHNWGSKHTDSYAWGQVAGFDDAPDVFLECATARLRLGPVWTPALTVVVLRVGEEEFALKSLSQSLRTHAHFDFFNWSIDAQSSDVRVSLTVSALRSAFVGLNYDNPPGGVKTCLNTKLAACELTVEKRGKAPRKFKTKHRAAFEILTERCDHGVALVA